MPVSVPDPLGDRPGFLAQRMSDGSSSGLLVVQMGGGTGKAMSGGVVSAFDALIDSFPRGRHAIDVRRLLSNGEIQRDIPVVFGEELVNDLPRLADE